MKKYGLKNLLRAAIAVSSIYSAYFAELEGCTRVLYQGSEQTVVLGRSMDWVEDIRSNLWVFSRGIEREGAVDYNPIKWTSKYGSVIVTGYDVGTADGMNEKGLVANLLYLAESDYGQPNGEKPLLSIALWAQYVLDQFANVSEAVDALRQEPFQVMAPMLPNGSPAQLHLSISDSTGDSAIFEYIQGKLVIHHGKEYQVMTNSPSYDQQLALNTYWKSIGENAFLPGTSRAADRFARAASMLASIPKTADPHYISTVPDRQYIYQAIASVLGVMRGVSVPLGVSTPGQPNIASTMWRTVSDQKNRVYYFDSATSPNTFWIPLSELNFAKGGHLMMLKLTDGKIYAGNAASHLQPAKPFAFLPAKFERKQEEKALG